MKLYEITKDMREIQALVERGELTPEMVADTIEGLDGQFEDKVRSTLKVRQGMLADIAGLDSELERLGKMKKTLQDSCDWLTDYVKNAMLMTQREKLDLGIFKLSLRKATEQLWEIDESRILAKYFTIIPESKKLDKRLLLKDAKISPVAGVKLGQSNRSLTIK
jgi:hypothetical protein